MHVEGESGDMGHLERIRLTHMYICDACSAHTCPVNSVSGFFIRCIRKNLQEKDTRGNACTVVATPSPPLTCSVPCGPPIPSPPLTCSVPCGPPIPSPPLTCSVPSGVPSWCAGQIHEGCPPISPSADHK